MKQRILTGITTTGTPHIGNYIGAIKPAIKNVNKFDESFFFLADYHSIIKTNNLEKINESVKNVALSWLCSDLDINKSVFYRQSDVPEILELTWILNCVTAKGLMNRAHAYKSAVSENTKEPDKGINMGLFSYPILMAADILMFDANFVPVGSDQIQHIEMTRDIANRFNYLYKETFNIPEALISSNNEVVPGVDGKKMSKSYKNIIPLLSSESELKKSIMKIVTNSLEPGEPKDHKDCTIFNLYKHFSTKEELEIFENEYADGISWGEAKNKLFNKINSELLEVREKYTELNNQPDLINDLLSDGAKKARSIAKEKILSVREAVGINKL